MKESGGVERTGGTLAEVARALNEGHPARGRLPALFFFTDETRLSDPVPVIARLPEGCGVVFRHYGVPERAEMARRVVRACREQHRLCVVAGDGALALAVQADGLHLPEHMLRNLTNIKRPRAGWLITAATHDGAALREAERLGIDAVFLSPVFATDSHPATPAMGPLKFTDLVAQTKVPVYALGGVTDETAPQLAGSGAVGIAAIGALLQA